MPRNTEVPLPTVSKWQEIVNMLASIMHVPAALIMQTRPPNIEVLVASESYGNPYHPAELAPLDTGLYCETVMATRQLLLVEDAREQEQWASNPDIKVGMVSYLGMPIVWPDGNVFGTICVLDGKANAYDDQFTKLLGLCRDMVQADLTLLMSLDQKIKQGEARIQKLVDADIIGIFLWEVETQTIVEANDTFLRTLGYDREDLATRKIRWTDLTPPEHLTVDLRDRLPVLKESGRLQPFEKDYLHKDGRRVPVLMGVARIDDGSGQAVTFVLDQTQRKLAEAEARDSERRYREVENALTQANRVTTMGQLTASLAHEMKQPIAACAMNAEAGLRWLRMSPPAVDEARMAFERVGKDAWRASEIMTRVRGLFRNAQMSTEPLALNDVVREVIGITKSEAEKHCVSIETDLADVLPVVHGDRVQLQQVLLNLIVNAIDALDCMAEGHARVLTIATAAQGDGSVTVTVRDTGPGFPHQQLPQLFEPFRTTKPTGMGMGLSICRSIVQAHGGTLSLCDGVPCGAAFSFTLPSIQH